MYVWDIIELYIELQQLRFIRDRTFGVYYLTRAFFAISVVEIGLIVGLLNPQNKAIIAFITPLILSTIFQNLVINIGGGEQYSINIKDIFDRFKQRIVYSLNKSEVRTRAKVQIELLASKSVSDKKIKDACLFHGTSTDFKKLEEKIKDLSDYEKRISYIQMLMQWGGPEAAIALLET